jgi:alcohol dehydrogenase class IV
MPTNYYMPTRIVSGHGALDEIGRLARALGITNALVVSDPVISAQTFHGRALARLADDGIGTARFDECGIDARCRHIDDQSERVRRDGIDGVISIGGGSVMCTGKGIAIVATNRKPMRECTGVGNFDRKALPMIMVPTTAGSGSEVSQWTIVKDEERHLKLLGGGPLSFPDAAILDPVTLDTLPMSAAAPPAVDALTHGLEGYLSTLASPLTDAVALEAVRLQAGSMRASITSNDPQARADNLIASTMANIACGNARLGHAHALSLPLEGHLDLVHTTGVGVLMPHVLAFNMSVDAVKARRLAEALGVDTEGLSRCEIIEAAVAELYDLYEDIGFQSKFTRDELPRDRIREMAERAVPGLYAGFSGATNAPENVTDRTIIVSPALRKMTVRQAEEIFEACAA